jgi:hypothetical protein
VCPWRPAAGPPHPLDGPTDGVSEGLSKHVYRVGAVARGAFGRQTTAWLASHIEGWRGHVRPPQTFSPLVPRWGRTGRSRRKQQSRHTQTQDLRLLRAPPHCPADR